MSDEADQVCEDQIGLDRSKRCDVQRRLTKLGSDVQMNGKFDDEIRNDGRIVPQVVLRIVPPVAFET